MLSFIKDLKKVPLIRVLVPFIFGIVLANFFPDKISTCKILCLNLIFILSFIPLKVFEKISGRKFHLLFGILVICAATLGGFLLMISTQNTNDRDFDHLNLVVEGKVMNALLEKENSAVLNIECSYVMVEDSMIAFRQNMVVYLSKDSGLIEVKPGEVWAFAGEARSIENRGNPGEFDYRSYMQRRNFSCMLFVAGNSHTRLLCNSDTDIKYFPARMRQIIMKVWKETGEDIAILSALTLGYKSLLDVETKNSFSDAGAMHLLAVSGLHVGMIWWILDMLIRVPGKHKFFRVSKVLVIVCILWFYAGMTGFSDSVCRSVTMFSLLALSKGIHRNSNVFNTLLLSAFLLLILKPGRLLEPGFQLSYVAVLGIVLIQPKLSSFYNQVNKFFKYFLELLSVSIAAQLSTLPLVLLYFHQFPVWFLLTNLVAIPLVSIILVLFVLFSPVFLWMTRANTLSHLLLWLTGLLEGSVGAISGLPHALIDNISISAGTAVGLMFILTVFILLLYYRKVIYLLLIILAISTVLGYSAHRYKRNYAEEKIEVYNFSGATIISSLSHLNRETFYFRHQKKEDPYMKDFITSLSRIPGSVSKHHIVNLNEGKDDLCGGIFLIDEGLWGIQTKSGRLLLAGSCKSSVLNYVMTAGKWKYLIFMRGYPTGIDRPEPNDVLPIIIGDGSLRSFEEDKLLETFAQPHIISRDGIYIMECNRIEGVKCIK